MSATTTTAAENLTDIPAALPAVESEDEREKLINQFADGGEAKTETRDRISETDDDDDTDADELVEIPKASKKKLFLAFVLFVAGFVLLLAALSWFFGIGVFAAPTKNQTVDRTRKNDSSAANAPLTEDEKLKNALNIVAEKSADTRSDTTDNANSPATSADSSQTIPAEKSADSNQPIVVPNLSAKTNYDSADVAANNVGANSNVAPTASTSSGVESSGSKNQMNSLLLARNEQNIEANPAGRSLFFGIARGEKTAVAQVSNVVQVTTKIENMNFDSTETAIPFGTLLPVRFLGAVYTLRASGGLVRMELTRAVAGKNYSYPAGTILVGTLRGSEYKRAYLSLLGMIDPKSGGLVKIEGEVMGSDGASGVLGKRRQVKGAWSRVLGGLCEAGRGALGALGNWRSGGGGTVVISDSSRKASGAITEELSGITNGRNNQAEFVEIAAGTNAYVLITDLPDEISNPRLAPNQKSATGLADDELADLFSEGSAEKIRAALPRMTPEFRRLAEAALAATENK